jgi:hypothetical protein
MTGGRQGYDAAGTAKVFRYEACEPQHRLTTKRRGEGRRGRFLAGLPRRTTCEGPFSSGPVNRFPRPAVALVSGRDLRHRTRRSPAATRRPDTTMFTDSHCTTGASRLTAAAVRGCVAMSDLRELLEAQPDLPRCAPDATAPRRDRRDADLAEFSGGDGR